MGDAAVTLCDLPAGGRGRIVSLDPGPGRHRLLELGLTTGATVELVRFAPLGDPIEIRVRGYLLSLRRTEAAGVHVTRA